MLMRIGERNILIYLVLAAISYHLESYEFFLYTTSYLHFYLFIDIYYYRRKYADDDVWEDFKRNCMVLKGIS